MASRMNRSALKAGMMMLTRAWARVRAPLWDPSHCFGEATESCLPQARARPLGQRPAARTHGRPREVPRIPRPEEPPVEASVHPLRVRQRAQEQAKYIEAEPRKTDLAVRGQ